MRKTKRKKLHSPHLEMELNSVLVSCFLSPPSPVAYLCVCVCVCFLSSRNAFILYGEYPQKKMLAEKSLQKFKKSLQSILGLNKEMLSMKKKLLELGSPVYFISLHQVSYHAHLQ